MIWLRSAVFNLWFYGATVVFAVASLAVRLGPASLTLRLTRTFTCSKENQRQV